MTGRIVVVALAFGCSSSATSSESHEPTVIGDGVTLANAVPAPDAAPPVDAAPPTEPDAGIFTLNTGILECDRLINVFMRCVVANAPANTKQQLIDQIKQMAQTFQVGAQTAQSRAQLAQACQQASAQVKQAAQQMGCNWPFP